MQYSRFLGASVCAAALMCAAPAFALGAHVGGGGSFHAGVGHGNFSAGVSHAGFSHGAVGGGHMAMNAGNFHRGGFNHGGFDRGRLHNGGGWYGGGFGYYGYPYGYDDAYDYPDNTDYAYGYPGDYAYDYPGYDSGYDYSPDVQTEAAVQPGNYCRTPVKMCQLYQPANVGADCSCRDGATRAYGQVTP